MVDLGKRRAWLAWALSSALLVVAGCRSESGYVECTPGALHLIGCNDVVGSPCSGEPEFRVCSDDVSPGDCVDGSSAELAFADSSVFPVACPETMFACPASGRVSVRVDSEDRDFCLVGVEFLEPLMATECVAGAMYEVGCTSMLGTTCTGDPTISVCMAGVIGCDRAASFAYNDDSEGRCPLVTFTCPPGGVVIEAAPFGSSPATCEFALRQVPTP